MAETTTDLPRPGEICSCGRPAVVVYISEDFGRVGDCGVENARPLNPCTDPMCPMGEPGRHDKAWCTPEARGRYRAVMKRRAYALAATLRPRSLP